jgi:hypothetical protein
MEERIFADTPLEIEAILIKRYRAMSPIEKLGLVAEMIGYARELGRLGIKRDHPEASEQEVTMRLASRFLDRETMIRVYGWDPELEGF